MCSKSGCGMVHPPLTINIWLLIIVHVESWHLLHHCIIMTWWLIRHHGQSLLIVIVLSHRLWILQWCWLFVGAHLIDVLQCTVICVLPKLGGSISWGSSWIPKVGPIWLLRLRQLLVTMMQVIIPLTLWWWRIRLKLRLRVIVCLGKWPYWLSGWVTIVVSAPSR